MNLEFLRVLIPLTSISFSLHVDLILQCQALIIGMRSLYTASIGFQFGVWMYTSLYCHQDQARLIMIGHNSVHTQ